MIYHKFLGEGLGDASIEDLFINILLETWHRRTMKIQPLGNRALIKEVEKEKETKSGIIIPDSASNNSASSTAKVLAVGPGKLVEGELVPPSIKKGDTIIYGRYQGTEVKCDGEELRLIDIDGVEGLITEE